jgi:hypothetical protein
LTKLQRRRNMQSNAVHLQVDSPNGLAVKRLLERSLFIFSRATLLHSPQYPL